ncbi:hypothetical protein [Shewanella ulleungensis]|uniref:Uncharacterized protein n=1 Tax=Shewanella ulleungensis TaxID=2282699 RepID=A0ABQ2QW89_9GAMM|nr:hypothetical protein [Shewanella ulleungensis]MCL1151358.1 hypothetical protein [Shewanella ulleungensis]GGP97454.1 hypothetical protein GCM10009410_34370 [Shewanella ulleungensis]
MTTRFNALFDPYLALKLSAFDNMKLVVAVLSEINDPYQCVEAKMKISSVNASMGSGYFVRWHDAWLFCGLTNSYSASIVLFTEIELIDMASLTGINIPVMTMQQVGFMCVESAHFDHC